MAAQSLSEAGGVKLQNAVERPVTEIITTALFSVFMQVCISGLSLYDARL